MDQKNYKQVKSTSSIVSPGKKAVVKCINMIASFYSGLSEVVC